MLTDGMYVADRYEIVGKIGAGGMSNVYKAKDHILGRFVAIKVLKQEFSEDRNFVMKFRTEAQSAAGLEHQNIVNIYDVGSEEGFHYIVMEYVEGITLKTYIEKKGQLSFKEAVSIAIQVSRGIEAAHNKNIIHRDIKPQNIIISTEGKVKVTDFGIAKAISSNTVSADVMGSVHYTSPEHARNGQVDGRSDIYSMGIVMYEMVTGRVPFDGDSTVAVAIQHLQEDMVVPSVYAPNLPISLEKIILKCTMKNPDRRYQSIGELLDDLRMCLNRPNDDFVVIAAMPEAGTTKVITADEIREISEGVPAETVAQAALAADADDDDAELEFEDFDDGEELSPKMQKAVTISLIVIAAIIGILIIFIIFKTFGVFDSKKKDPDTEPVVTEETQPTQSIQKKEFEMISLLGKTVEEAETLLRQFNVKINSKGTEDSDEYEENQIVWQEPEAGKKLEEGAQINVKLAGKKEVEVSVPGVTKKAKADAVRLLTDAKLDYEVSYEYSNDVAADYVISQSPSAGTSVSENTKVKIVVSQGKEAVEVPNVVGMPVDSAESTLAAKGFEVTITETYSSEVADGFVISSNPGANKKVSYGTAVTLTVSKGEQISLYNFNYSITAPEAAVSYEYELTDTQGKVLASATNQKCTEGQSINLSKNGLTVPSGNITVRFKCLDAEGNEIDGPSSSEQISFAKQ